MKTVGMGLVGAGGWGAMHARTYATTPGAKLVAVADEDFSRARSLAERHGARAYASWHNLVADAEVDAMAVVTPDFAHEEILLAGAAAGKHLLAEKPLALSTDACERIVAAAAAAKVKLMVDFHARWSPPLHKAWEAVRAGEIGAPLHVYYRLNDTIHVPTRMLSWAARSSVLWFVGSHAIDTVRWLVGSEVTRVYAVARKMVLVDLGIDTPDYYLSTIEFENGAVAVIENSWVLPNASPNLVDVKCELVGTKGALHVDQSHCRALEKYTDDSAGFPDVFVMPSIFGVQQGFAAASIRHFIEAVASDVPLLVTGRDGLEVTRVITALERSVRQRMPVELERPGSDRK